MMTGTQIGRGKYCGTIGQVDDTAGVGASYSVREVRKIDYSREPAFFMHFTDDWDVGKFPSLWAIGNAELIKGQLLALFCSRKCPGVVVRKGHDLADALRRKGTPVIGGFQTPVERDCLEVLLGGTQPVVVCPPRGIQRLRVPVEWRKSVEDGRLLILSPFNSKHRRANASSAEIRNRFVASAARRVFFVHAAPKSRTLALAADLLMRGREIITFNISENSNLKDLGANCTLDASPGSILLE